MASHFMVRGLFVSEVDGFLYQILSVSSGGELGVLNLAHTARYFVVSPFLFVDNIGFPNKVSLTLQNFILFIYLSPLFFWRSIPRHIRVLSVGLLFISLFLSYRTVLLMEAVFIMTSFIKWNFFQFKYFLYACVLGVLSSGIVALLAVLLLLLIVKNNHLNNKVKRMVLFFGFILVIVLMPSLAHKLLFYSNPSLFGSASSIELSYILNLSLVDLQNIFWAVIERSFVYEGFNNPEYFYRVYISITVVLLSVLLLIISPGALSLFFLFFTIIGVFLEGMVLYSLIFTLIALNYNYFYRRISV